VTRIRLHTVEDLDNDFEEDSVDCYTCLASTCTCYQPTAEDKTALQELSDSTAKTTMSQALARAGVIDDE
jgi:hypothetical protein